LTLSRLGRFEPDEIAGPRTGLPTDTALIAVDAEPLGIAKLLRLLWTVSSMLHLGTFFGTAAKG
jgi:hypothetical protein